MPKKLLAARPAAFLIVLALALPARAGEAPFLVAEDPPDNTTITLTFLGDCILGGEEKDRRKPESFDSVAAEKGFDWPFSGLYNLLSCDDYTLINLEGVLKDDEGGKAAGRLHNFRGPSTFARMLPLGSVEGVNLANNHYGDYQRAGRESTLSALEENGIRYSGWGHLDIFEKDGVRIGFGGIREAVWLQDRAQMALDIQALKDQGCHFIVYSCHFGQEYAARHNALQTEMARAAVDAGADLIIGHHPHVVQGVESYGGGVILYSLGNATFGGNLKLSEFEALTARITLHFRYQRLSGGTLRLIPILTTGTRPDNDFRPIPAQGEDAARILSRIQADSAIPLDFVMALPLPLSEEEPDD